MHVICSQDVNPEPAPEESLPAAPATAPVADECAVLKYFWGNCSSIFWNEILKYLQYWFFWKAICTCSSPLTFLGPHLNPLPGAKAPSWTKPLSGGRSWKPQLGPKLDCLLFVSGDDADEDDWQQRLPKDAHDIVKHREHGGECRKCGKVGSWEFIKSSPCNPGVAVEGIDPSTQQSLPLASTTDNTEKLGKMLEVALDNENENAALEIVAKMEAEQAQQSLEDQELITELMQQELDLIEAMEQMEQLEILEALENEEEELQEALLLSKQPLDKQSSATRPPATPCTSSSTPPMVGKPVVAQPPSACFLVTWTYS